MAVVSQGKDEFLARVQRIEKRGAGVSELFNAESARARRHINRANRACRGCILKLPLAMVVGAISFVAAQYATFLIGDLPEEFANPDYILIGQSVLALFLVFVCRFFFHLTAKTHMVLSILGLVAAMSLMHNLVHLAPEPWAELFSSAWVNELRTHTEPGTLYFRGTTYPLDQLSLG